MARRFGYSQAESDATEVWAAAQMLGLHETPGGATTVEGFQEESLRLINERMAAQGAPTSGVGVPAAMMEAFRQRRRTDAGTPGRDRT